MPMGMGPEGDDAEVRGLHEVYLPARVLSVCLPGWETADDSALTQAVGEAMDHAYWHWRWLAAIRKNRCRLTVVQHRDVENQPMLPHYQLGDMFTLSQWHPERALAEAQLLVADGAEGLAFDLPINDEMKDEWRALVTAAGLDPDDADGDPDEPGAFDTMISAMVLLDDAHDRYVAELGTHFYVATRGLKRDIDRLLLDDFGRWSAETMQIVDKGGTATSAHIFPEDAEGLADMQKPVPVVYPPVAAGDDGGEEGAVENDAMAGLPDSMDDDEAMMVVRRPHGAKLN